MKRALLKIYFTIKCQLYGIKNFASNSMHYGEKWINNLFYEFYSAATCYNAEKGFFFFKSINVLFLFLKVFWHFIE